MDKNILIEWTGSQCIGVPDIDFSNFFAIETTNSCILTTNELVWTSSFDFSTRKIIFLFFNQNICCGYSKEPSQWDGSFEHPKHMLIIMGKKIFTILRWKFLFI